MVPQINEGNSDQLNIEQEVSNVLGANGAVDVRFAKLQLNTSVMMQEGQMLVLGGLIDERALESESKVPLLGIWLCWVNCSAQPARKWKRKPDGVYQPDHYS